LPDTPEVRSHSGGFPAPESVEIGLPNAGQQQRVVISWVPTLEVAKNTQVTLERCEQVVPVSSVKMSVHIFLTGPHETPFIMRERSGE
jgi:hypothetical protein